MMNPFSSPNGAAPAEQPQWKPDPEAGWTPQIRAVVAYNRRLLLAALESLEGTKAIIWNRSVMRVIDTYMPRALLREAGVHWNVVLDEPVRSPAQHVLFILDKSLGDVTRVAEFMERHGDDKVLYRVLVVPEVWHIMRERLKENPEVWRRLEQVAPLPLWWQSVHGDAISFEDPTIPSRILLNGDWTVLHSCATALHLLERMSTGGEPLKLHTRGKWAGDVASMLVRLRASGANTQSNPEWLPRPASGALKLERLVIIDRWQDPLTPLLVPATYAAVLDEVFGIDAKGNIRVRREEFGEVSEEIEKLQRVKEEWLVLPLFDEVFHRMKHVHLGSLASHISSTIAEIKRDESYDRENTSIAELGFLVKKLSRISYLKQKLALHTRLIEMLYARNLEWIHEEREELQKNMLQSKDGDRVLAPIEDAIVDAVKPATIPLRWIAIQSTASGGLKTSVLQAYRKLIAQSYGVKALNQMVKMQKIGLIREKEGKSLMATPYPETPYATQHFKGYNLIPNVDQDFVGEPKDASYYYSYYASLLVRLVEEGLAVNWVGWKSPSGTASGGSERGGSGGTALFVIGGITRAEISALRRVKGIDLIASSAVLTRDKVINSLTTIM